MKQPHWRHTGMTLALLAGLACTLTACADASRKTTTSTPFSFALPTTAPAPTITPVWAIPSGATPIPTLASYAAPCRGIQLRLMARPGGVALGHVATDFQATNTSASPCSLQGFASLALMDDTWEKPLAVKVEYVTMAYMWVNAPTDAVQLVPGGSAYFMVQTDDVSPPGQQCITSGRIFITVSHTAQGFVSPIQLTTCDGMVYVSPFVASLSEL